MTTPIIIEDYNPGWPERFEEICSRIAPALGDLAARIEHVGSTAVPGLASKPIIDLDILLHAADDLPAVVLKLKALGYKHQGTLGIPGREAFKSAAHDIPHHLYVCLPDGPEYARHIAFRNFLRTHREDAEASCAKQRLQKRNFRPARNVPSFSGRSQPCSHFYSGAFFSYSAGRSHYWRWLRIRLSGCCCCHSGS
jgi:GrpB-like predicted nucleotidyltransferase (UPF0157 family)